MGEGMAYGGLPFPDTSCPLPDVHIYYVPDMINGYCLYTYPPPFDATAHGFF